MRPKLIIHPIFLPIILVLIMFCGCAEKSNEIQPDNGAADTGTVEEEYIYGTANVDDIDIIMLESFPVQIHVNATGYLPDGCTGIDRIETGRYDNTFTVSITTKRPRDLMCTQALVPFEETISLDVYGLKAGTYDVTVNDASGSFTLDVDNIPGNGQIAGRVYTEADNGSTVDIDTGGSFTIRLDENPTTGYNWSLDATGGLEVVRDVYIAPDTELVGAGGVHEWEIRAVGVGTQQVSAVYRRPWEDVTGDEQRFELTVEVK